MINLYDHEVKSIYEEIQYVQKKWWGKSNTSENMDRLQRELIGRLEDLGFTAIVDVSPTLEGHPVDVRIEGRTDTHEFDHELKAHEVQKQIERNDPLIDL